MRKGKVSEELTGAGNEVVEGGDGIGSENLVGGVQKICECFGRG